MILGKRINETKVAMRPAYKGRKWQKYLKKSWGKKPLYSGEDQKTEFVVHSILKISWGHKTKSIGGDKNESTRERTRCNR